MVYRPAPIHHIGSASKDVPSGHSQNDSWKARHYGIFSAVRHSWLSWWVERNTENSAKFQVDMSCTLWTVLHTETHLTFCATQLSLFKVAYVPRGRKLTSTHGRGQWKKKQLKHATCGKTLRRSKIIWKGMHISFSKTKWCFGLLLLLILRLWDIPNAACRNKPFVELLPTFVGHIQAQRKGLFGIILPKIFHVKNKQVRVNSITVAIG